MTPKGMVADHWRWRGGAAVADGWHCPKKRKAEAQPDHKPSGRGLFERAAAVAKSEPQAMPTGSGPSKRKLREMAAPPRPARIKLKQAKLF